MQICRFKFVFLHFISFYVRNTMFYWNPHSKCPKSIDNNESVTSSLYKMWLLPTRGLKCYNYGLQIAIATYRFYGFLARYSYLLSYRFLGKKIKSYRFQISSWVLSINSSTNLSFHTKKLFLWKKKQNGIRICN